VSKATPMFSESRREYETPHGGITIGGYVARRLHKTSLLKPVTELIKRDRARALAQIALYAAAASTSFGAARYQPDSDAVGAVIETTDPETGARVTVRCERHLRFSYRVEMKGVGVMSGSETITGTTVGLRGLGMPAPTTFVFMAEHGNYRADLVGIITSELAPRIGTWHIRGYGALDLSDNAGNRGRLSLDRSGLAFASITNRDGSTIELKENLV
jgi:hypothetical protein